MLNACSSGQAGPLQPSTRSRSDTPTSVHDTHTETVDEHVDASTVEVSWHTAVNHVGALRAANTALARQILDAMRLRAARCIEQGGSLECIEQGGCTLDVRVPVRDVCVPVHMHACLRKRIWRIVFLVFLA